MSSQINIWPKRWNEKLKNPYESTGLDYYASQSLNKLIPYINDNTKLVLEIGTGTGRLSFACLTG